MQLQLTSEGEGVGVASDGAIDEVPGVSKGIWVQTSGMWMTKLQVKKAHHTEKGFV